MFRCLTPEPLKLAGNLRRSGVEPLPSLGFTFQRPSAFCTREK